MLCPGSNSTPKMIILAVVLGLFVSWLDGAKNPEEKEKQRMAVLPPCSACKTLVESFESGLKRTARGKLEGGDTAWEEKNQGKGYANSEVRFVEIQEKLCSEIGRGEAQCHQNHHTWEDHLEEWWNMGEGRPGLKKWLCEEKLSACCPDNHFGPACQPCSVFGDNGKLCSGNGKCKGAGTRKGSGKCLCDKAHSGEKCDSCAEGYYKGDEIAEASSGCVACHAACIGCTGPGPLSCLACKSGYRLDTERGCEDIDECSDAGVCSAGTFCANTEGSHVCAPCDKSCRSCHADGPDSCTACAAGYVRGPGQDGLCVTEETAGRTYTLTNVRYLTYAGLCVATAIVFQRSALMAGSLGMVVAAYVALSEYYLQGATGELRPVSGF